MNPRTFSFGFTATAAVVDFVTVARIFEKLLPIDENAENLLAAGRAGVAAAAGAELLTEEWVELDGLAAAVGRIFERL